MQTALTPDAFCAYPRDPWQGDDMSRREIDWDKVFQAGRKLGAGERAMNSWKQRLAVPHKYRVYLVRESRGAFTLSDFEALDRKRGREVREQRT